MSHSSNIKSDLNRDEMTVAVIMSVYRQDDPTLLKDAIISIINQDVPDNINIRIYLGIDGPITRELQSVIDIFINEIHLIYKGTKNQGLAHILNELISRLKGERYIFRMDADDRSAPQRFARQINYLEANPDIDIVGTAIVEYDVVAGSRRIVRFARDPVAARRDIAKRPPIAHPTACFRGRVFEVVGGYPIVLFSEDVALWFKCLEAGMKFDNLPEPLYEFTINASFWTRRGVRKAWAEYRTWSRGVHRLDGATWRQIYPLARLLMRVGPRKLQQILYSKFLRQQASLDPALSPPP